MGKITKKEFLNNLRVITSMLNNEELFDIFMVTLFVIKGVKTPETNEYIKDVENLLNIHGFKLQDVINTIHSIYYDEYFNRCKN